MATFARKRVIAIKEGKKTYRSSHPPFVYGYAEGEIKKCYSSALVIILI